MATKVPKIFFRIFFPRPLPAGKQGHGDGNGGHRNPIDLPCFCAICGQISKFLLKQKNNLRNVS